MRKSDLLQTSIFLVWKVRLQVIFGGASVHAGIIEFSNFLMLLKSQRSGSKTVCRFSITFSLKGVMKFCWKGQRVCGFCWSRIKTFVKMRRNQKCTTTHSFKEINHVLQLVSKLQIKSKTVMSWSSRKKKECIFCNVYFVRRNLF